MFVVYWQQRCGAQVVRLLHRRRVGLVVCRLKLSRTLFTRQSLLRVLSEVVELTVKSAGIVIFTVEGLIC